MPGFSFGRGLTDLLLTFVCIAKNNPHLSIVVEYDDLLFLILVFFCGLKESFSSLCICPGFFYQGVEIFFLTL